MLIGNSISIEALQGEPVGAPIRAGWKGALSQAASRLIPGRAGPGMVVKTCLPAEHYDLAPVLSEAALSRTSADSFLRYTTYDTRPFVVAEGREIVSGLHSKAIAAPGRGLIDEFNVGGGAGMPVSLLELDFEYRDDGLHVGDARVERHSGLSIPLSHYGVGTFGHFVLDGLLQVYMFRRELEAGARVLHWHLPEAWMGRVLDRCGASRRREASTLIVQMERAGLSSALAGHGVYFPGSWSIGFFDWLRTRMDVPERTGGGRLFIRRAARFGRVIGNADEVEALACAYGFKAVSPEDYPLDEQMRLFADSSVALSAWGSTLTLAPMLSGSRIVVELLPSSVRDAWFQRQVAVHRLDHRPLLQSADAMGNMEIDLEALEILLRALPA